MYSLKTSAAFDSAHFLAGYEGKCANIHGHRWVIEATFGGEELCSSGTERGMLMDFSGVKREVRTIADGFDHALIYENGSLKAGTLAALREEGFALIEVPFRPTAENFAEHFYMLLHEKNLPVKSVAVYETPENCAVYEVKP